MQALRDLEPLVNRLAGAAHRHMPASADIEDVRQVARIAAWEADVEFVPGVGSREGFIAQRVQRRIIDWQRQQTPGGRNSPGYVFADVDDAHDLAAPDDPAGDLEHSRQFEACMSALPKAVRKQAEGALAGRGKVSEKLLSLVQSSPKRRAASQSFDPDSVRFEIGGMPPPKPAKRTKLQMLVDRWPAQGATPVGVQLYAALKKAFAAAGVTYVATKTSDTTYWVCREPSPEQRAAIKRGKVLK